MRLYNRKPEACDSGSCANSARLRLAVKRMINIARRLKDGLKQFGGNWGLTHVLPRS